MNRSSPWLTASLQTVILLTVVACATPWLNAAESSLPIPRRSGDIALRGHHARPVFNGSVVAGGVYAADELRAAIGRDPVIADHYRAVKLEEMEVVTLTAGRAAYVSYRRGDRVYWTRERVWLKAGETVLTDGTTTIRARCGNCVSDVKQEHVAAVDPAHGELDDFVVPPTPEGGVDSLAADAEAGLGDLLEVPFAPQSFAALAPGGAPLVPDLLGEPYGPGGFPVGGLPPIILPGGGSDETGGIAETGTTDIPGDESPTPPAGFVPPAGGGSLPTSGSLTTGLPGLVTDGTVFLTTVGGTTSSSGATSAPEPGTLWLVAAGVIGLASRRLRMR